MRRLFASFFRSRCSLPSVPVPSCCSSYSSLPSSVSSLSSAPSASWIIARIHQALQLRDAVQAWRLFLALEDHRPRLLPRHLRSALAKTVAVSLPQAHTAANSTPWGPSQAVEKIIATRPDKAMVDPEDVASLLHAKLFADSLSTDEAWNLLLEHWPQLFTESPSPPLAVSARGYALFIRAAVSRGGKAGMRDLHRVYLEMARASVSLDAMTCAAFMREFKNADHRPGALDLRRRMASLSRDLMSQRASEDLITILARAGDISSLMEEISEVKLCMTSVASDDAVQPSPSLCVSLSMVNDILSCRSRLRLSLRETFDEYFTTRNADSTQSVPLRPCIATLSIIVQDGLARFRDGFTEDPDAISLIKRCREMLPNMETRDPAVLASNAEKMSLEAFAITTLLDALSHIPSPSTTPQVEDSSSKVVSTTSQPDSSSDPTPLRNPPRSSNSQRQSPILDRAKVGYAILMNHLSKSQQPHAARELLMYMQSTNRTPDASMIASFNSSLITPATNSTSDSSSTPINNVPLDVTDRYSATTLMTTLFKAGRVQDAMSVLAARHPTSKTDPHMITSVLSGLRRNNHSLDENPADWTLRTAGDVALSNRHVVASLIATTTGFDARGGLRSLLPITNPHKDTDPLISPTVTDLITNNKNLVVDAGVVSSALRLAARPGDPVRVESLIETLNLTSSTDMHSLCAAAEAMAACGDMPGFMKLRSMIADSGRGGGGDGAARGLVTRLDVAQLWAAVKSGDVPSVDTLLRNIILAQRTDVRVGDGRGDGVDETDDDDGRVLAPQCVVSAVEGAISVRAVQRKDRDVAMCAWRIVQGRGVYVDDHTVAPFNSREFKKVRGGGGTRERMEEMEGSVVMWVPLSRVCVRTLDRLSIGRVERVIRDEGVVIKMVVRL